MALSVLLLSVMVASQTVAQPVDDQQPQFHPGPAKNWMNDPNGPMYYKGYYHLFFQYNPLGASWGHMSWGHIVSKDLAHWKHLPVALSPDMPYDNGGVFTGSATIRDDGTPIITYTCVSGGQRQCIAIPADPNDAMLVNWTKPTANPVIRDPPTNGTLGQFRDDTTAWKVSDGSWRMVVGASISGKGSASLWKTTNFYNWTYIHPLAQSEMSSNAGMWECPDFFPMPGDSKNRYILKYSAGGDWYEIGTYDEKGELFHKLTEPARYDYGQFYASKRFYDPVGKRQILYGWSAEESHDAAKRGWQGHQTLPRSLAMDDELNALVYTPVEELVALRKTNHSFTDLKPLAPGQVMMLEGVMGLQLEIVAVFKMASTSASMFGPAGVAVRVSSDMKTMTSVVVNEADLHGPLNNTDLPGDEYEQYPLPVNVPEEQNVDNCSQTCQAQSHCVAWTYVRAGDPHVPRCSLKNGIPNVNPNKFCVSGTKQSGATGTLMVNRTLSGGDSATSARSGNLPFKSSDTNVTVHIFVDHSMIEALGQNGRSCVTAHVYPDSSAAGVALVNFGSAEVTPVSVDVWEMDSCWIE